MKITITERILFSTIVIAVFVVLVALAVSGINLWVLPALGSTVFIVGIAVQIIAGKKDNNTLLNIAILLEALGGMTTLISILTVIGFFDGALI